MRNFLRGVFFSLLVFPPFFVRGQIEQDTAMHAFAPDFTTFDQRTPVVTDEMTHLTPSAYQANPDYGILPDNAPCTDCIELIQKRTLNSRYYIQNGTGGNVFYVQTSYGNFNYVDSAGWIRAIDPKLYPVGGGIYKADIQPVPATLNMNDGTTTMSTDGLSLVFNTNTSVYHVTDTSATLLSGAADLYSSTVGKNGAYTTNAWPGIDRQLVFNFNSVETDYILNTAPNTTSQTGWYGFNDEITLPPGYVLFEDTISGGIRTPEGFWQGSLVVINTSDNAEEARWAPVVVYDNIGNRAVISNGAYQVIQNGNTYTIRTLVKESWLTSSSTVYPVTVDPLVSGAATYSAGNIGFSIYAPGDGFCGSSSAYCYGGPLNVTFPGQATATNAIWGLTYRAFAPAWRSDGGFRMVGPCGEDPANTDNWYSCAVNSAGNCVGSGFNAPWLVTCLTPSCVATTVPFHVKNIDCFGWAGPCSTAVLQTTNNTWNVTVQGHTTETLGNSASGNGSTTTTGTCCTATTLNPSPLYGVPAYTYSWSTGATSPTISVSSCTNGSTVYTCTVTDACGISRTATITFSVSSCVLPVELTSFTGEFQPGLNSVLLNWNVASEHNNNYYLVERTTDGIHFDAVGRVFSKAPGGNSSEPLDYSLTDPSPPSGVVYYKLSQVDISGNEQTEGYIAVSVSADGMPLQIVPNPANDNALVTYFSPAEAESEIRLVDVTGRVLFSETQASKAGLNSFDIPVKGCTSGVYFVRVTSGSSAQVARLIIQ
ncbi:MAG TPA: T9SS type A sorting domain-containing protein [Bacteroidia bacterium]|nr:T9SS type A sorting domain-containing protein [Bacteroidia bacterium]